MFRAVLSVIAGWLVMAVVIMIIFGVTMLALGAEGVYRPGAYWTTDTFNAIVLVGGLGAAVLGGFVCALIARSRKPPLVFAALTLAFGLTSAVLNLGKPDPEPPSGTPTFEEGMARGKEPNWFAFTAPLLGAGGIVLGSKLRKQATPDRPAS